MAYYCVTASIERLNAKVIPDGPREVQACLEITELWDLKRLECEIVGFSPYLLLLLAPGSRAAGHCNNVCIISCESFNLKK